MTGQAPLRATVRAYEPGDFEPIVDLWHRAKRAAYTYLPLEQARTVEEDREFFRDSILARCRIWVCAERGRLLGYLAMDGGYVDRLYVDPDHQGRGAGSLLLGRAFRESPAGIDLHTHQENEAARRFYEGRGFRAVAFGTSPAPGRAPDVLYRWRPAPEEE